ncbi:hypothetical protein [Chryseobacterium gallinarum]|uniref:hypothetical protein n=1 Tax=Chryseobacterium gallinarum TaxID=1324352 RepID=UPI0012E0067C|nr:hypothetical protein [Chryseobacterium gallinarum]
MNRNLLLEEQVSPNQGTAVNGMMMAAAASGHVVTVHVHKKKNLPKKQVFFILSYFLRPSSGFL